MSIAWELSKNGAAVTVFDAGRVGNESSWTGAGMLAPGGEVVQRDRFSNLAVESLRLYPEFVSELSLHSGVPIDFRQCGAFSLAYSEQEGEALRSLAATQNAMGIYSEQFAPNRVPGVRSGATAAQYYPGDSVVNPRDLLRALVVACRRAQVTIREFEPVFLITDREATDRSGFDVTVLSAGAWSNQVRVVLSGDKITIPEVTPVRGHLVAFDLTMPPPISDAIVRHNHTYVFPRGASVPGSWVIAGATTEHCGFDRAIDGRIAQQLAASASGLMPCLEGCGYSAWNGFRPATANGQPAIEKVADSSIWLAYGHYRNGILMAPATARLLATEILSLHCAAR
jgi:glycine oxidase